MDFDFFAPFAIPCFFLQRFGLWQDKDSRRTYRAYGILLHVLIIEVFVFCHTVHSINMFAHGSIMELSDALSFLFTLYAVAFKSIWFWLNVDKIKEMMDSLKTLLELSSFDLADKGSHIKAHSIQISKIMKRFYGLTFIAITAVALLTLFRYKDKRLLFETWFFLDHNGSDGVHLLLVVYQCIEAFYGTAINYSFDLIPVIFISFISTMLDELSLKISLIGSQIKLQEMENDYERDDANLKKCIEFHIKIQNLASKVSKHLSFAFLVQAFMSTVILCSSAFMLTTVTASILYQLHY